jgi:hypothetical protein
LRVYEYTPYSAPREPIWRAIERGWGPRKWKRALRPTVASSCAFALIRIHFRIGALPMARALAAKDAGPYFEANGGEGIFDGGRSVGVRANRGSRPSAPLNLFWRSEYADHSVSRNATCWSDPSCVRCNDESPQR